VVVLLEVVVLEVVVLEVVVLEVVVLEVVVLEDVAVVVSAPPDPVVAVDAPLDDDVVLLAADVVSPGTPPWMPKIALHPPASTHAVTKALRVEGGMRREYRISALTSPRTTRSCPHRRLA
jgi:hypothetical protein